MNRSFWVLLCVVFTLLNILPSSADPCVFQNIDISSYDSSDTDVPLTDSSGNSYYIQPCHNTQACSGKTGVGESPLCQKDGGGAYHGCGTIASALEGALVGGGYWIYYTNGDSTNQGPRTANISCVCAPTVTGQGQYSPASGSAYEVDTGDYQVSFKHQICCGGGPSPPPGPHGGGGGFDYGWVFVIVVCCAVVVYLIGGVIVMKVAYNAEGAEMIPNLEFWKSTPGLLKDGVMYIVNKIRGNSGYSTF